jgi:hypothetical protein
MTVRSASTKTIVIAALICGVIAGVLNVAIAAIAGALDVPMQAAQRGNDFRTDLAIPMFFVSSMFGAVGGFVIAKIVSAKEGAARLFVIVASILTVFSMVTPITADATTATKVVLALTHVVAAAVLIPGIARTIRN